MDRIIPIKLNVKLISIWHVHLLGGTIFLKKAVFRFGLAFSDFYLIWSAGIALSIKAK